MYKATLIIDADAGVLAMREDTHVANELAYRAWKEWKNSGSCSSAFETLDMDMVDDYIRSQSVDPYFLDFYDFVSERRILFGVATQRLGRIVETILRREGLGGVPVFANKLDVEPFTIRLSFPHYMVLGCDLCPSCNVYHLRRFRRPDAPLIFVGDKEHDLCSCLEADLVFARNGLHKRLEKEGIEHHSFEHLRDVERKLMNMIMSEELSELPRRKVDLLSPPPVDEDGKPRVPKSRN
jgi:2-hydroxy-3-keto-5-methylthiopentenyl-1-phosphate phosphatase